LIKYLFNITVYQMSNISITHLNEIKKELEQKSKEKEIEEDFIESDSLDSSNSSHKKRNISEYTNIIEKLETRIHYMKLDIVNKDIEISELNEKINTTNKINTFFHNSELLFERLNNAHFILSEKLNSKPVNDSYKQLLFLENTYNLCRNTIEKYHSYLEVSFNIQNYTDHKYSIIAIEFLFSNKMNELILIHDKVNKQITYIKFKQMFNHILLHIFFLVIIFSIFFNFYYYK